MIQVNSLTAAVVTISDKASKGERIDTSGESIKDILVEEGYKIIDYIIVPDEEDCIVSVLEQLCDNSKVNLIITTGGTGLSIRDRTPEATIRVAHKMVPGISEAIRLYSMKVTKRAMLGRGVAVIRNNTLIINLPGSNKAVKESLEYIINEIEHGILIMLGSTNECGNDVTHTSI